MVLTQPSEGTIEYGERSDADLVAVAQAGDNLAMEFLLRGLFHCPCAGLPF
jgi:hypothetical protein